MRIHRSHLDEYYYARDSESVKDKNGYELTIVERNERF